MESLPIELIFRFIVGGMVVTVFALVGDLLRPKTFSGIFGGAPSVALATLGLTFAMKGGTYAGIEGRSMVLGAVAFFVYVLPVHIFLARRQLDAVVLAAGSWAVWLVVAFGLWAVLLR